MQFQFVGAERARQFAVDEFLIGRNRVDRQFEGNDAAWAFLIGRTQRQLGPAREFAAGGGMLRRLRKTGVRAHPHHGVEPMRAGDIIQNSA